MIIGAVILIVVMLYWGWVRRRHNDKFILDKDEENASPKVYETTFDIG